MKRVLILTDEELERLLLWADFVEVDGAYDWEEDDVALAKKLSTAKLPA